MKFIAALALQVLFIFAARAGDEITVLTAKGEQLKGQLSGEGGSWRLGPNSFPIKDALLIRFSGDGAAARVDAGVFIRGGSLIAGTLLNLIGDQAEIVGTSLGALKLKRDDIAGAFFALPSGESENMPALAHYSAILGATLNTQGAALTPGRECRIRFAGLDEMAPDKIMRIGTDQILAMTKAKAIETVKRQFVREIELPVAALSPAPDDEKLGAEVVVRLKAGDLIRGRMLKFSGEGLKLKTTFAGERTLPRNLLAALFVAGGEFDNASGVTWLSAVKPAKAVHTPVFDASFPARSDSSVDGNDMRVQGVPLERGIGVHSRSELTFTLDGAPRRFVSLCGIDDETKGRGGVTAKILADGKEVWASGEVNGKSPLLLVNADLGSAKSVTLFVDYGADGDDSGDHFDWGWAAVVRK